MADTAPTPAPAGPVTPSASVTSAKVVAMEPDPWDAKFGIEVSRRYHDWRRGTVMTLIRFAKGTTFVGAIVTLLTALALDWEPVLVKAIIVVISVVVALVNLWELVSSLDDLALQHAELYRRFAELQAKMSKDASNERLGEWEAEAAKIRADEPPTMWAVYALCWNQTVERYHGGQAKSYTRRVGFFAYLLRNFIQFRPQDFPSPAS